MGYEKTLSTGHKQMLDSRGRVTGYYNPKTNRTITGQGRDIGSEESVVIHYKKQIIAIAPMAQIINYQDAFFNSPMPFGFLTT